MQQLFVNRIRLIPRYNMLSAQCLTIYTPGMTLHRNKSLLSLVELNKIWIAVTVFGLIWNEKEIHFMLYQSEKCNYNPDLV